MNKETQTAENLYYRDIDPSDASPARRDQSHGRAPAALPNRIPGLPSPTTSSTDPIPSATAKPKPKGQPPYLFSAASELLRICQTQDLTIGQVVWENELAFRSPTEIRSELLDRMSSFPDPFYDGSPLYLVVCVLSQLIMRLGQCGG